MRLNPSVCFNAPEHGVAGGRSCYRDIRGWGNGRRDISTTHQAGTLLVAQSGGPTAVINASLAGVIRASRESGRFVRILGSRRGVEGILADAYVDLTDLAGDRLARLRCTPSAALGTSRQRPSDDEVEEILNRFAAIGIDTFVPIGGNDTAETALRLSAAASARRQSLRVVTVPKTIDNDLPETDHCPGYGSIARFVALSTLDASLDTRAMAHLYPVKIVEVMGRNAGWLAAAGALAFDAHPGLPRPIICLPERPFESIDALTTIVRSSIDRDGYAVLVTPETMKWGNGSPVGGDTPVWIDSFGHKYFPGVGDALARQLSSLLNVRARFDKPGTIARMAMHAASPVDVDEACQAGAEAVRRAASGESGVMVTIVREQDDPYRVRYDTTPLDRVANSERQLPDELIAASGHDVVPEFAAYAVPLLGPALPRYEVLD